MKPRIAVIVFLLLCAGMALSAAWADRHHHDDIKRLRDAGEILSLETIVDNYRKQYREGQVLEAELEFEEGRHVYELKILQGNGTVRELKYDAKTGVLIEEGH